MQGGILSPFLFPDYIDELIEQLRRSGYGIFIGSLFYGCIFLQMILYCYPVAVLVLKKCCIYVENMESSGT